MKRSLAWLFLLVLAGLTIVMARDRGPEESTGSDNQRRIVRIELGAKSFDYADKSDYPFPVVELGKPFDVVVRWGEETDGYTLSLSGFRTVSLAEDGEVERWRWDSRDPSTTLALSGMLDGKSVPLDDNTMLFEKADGDESSKTFILGPKDYFKSYGPPRPRLIKFKIEVRDGDGRELVFRVDPPWEPWPPKQ